MVVEWVAFVVLHDDGLAKTDHRLDELEVQVKKMHRLQKTDHLVSQHQSNRHLTMALHLLARTHHLREVADSLLLFSHCW